VRNGSAEVRPSASCRAGRVGECSTAINAWQGINWTLAITPELEVELRTVASLRIKTSCILAFLALLAESGEVLTSRLVNQSQVEGETTL
jgi:hypothetical protein